jgi:hypothetical protein
MRGSVLQNNHRRTALAFLFDSGQSAIGIGERKCDHRRTQADVARESEEVAGILAGHVGHAAQLALAPEERIVVEGGHLVEVDGVNRHHSALAQRNEGADDHRSHGCEGDGAIELDRRFGIHVADPRGPGVAGCLLARRVARDDIDFAVPGTENLQGECRGAAIAEETDARAALDAGYAQAAEADDAGAQQRGDVDGVEFGGNGPGKVRTNMRSRCA